MFVHHCVFVLVLLAFERLFLLLELVWDYFYVLIPLDLRFCVCHHLSVFVLVLPTILALYFVDFECLSFLMSPKVRSQVRRSPRGETEGKAGCCRVLYDLILARLS